MLSEESLARLEQWIHDDPGQDPAGQVEHPRGLLVADAVADDAVAAGIGRDIAADGATAARAEIERKHHAVLLDPLLELLQRRAGLRDRDAALTSQGFASV